MPLFRKSRPAVAGLPNDDLAADLQKLVNDSVVSVFHPNGATPTAEADMWAAALKHDMLERLAIYITERDHKVMKHGIKLGEERAKTNGL